MPRLSPAGRCALTAPFHPYLISVAGAIGGCSLWHCPSVTREPETGRVGVAHHRRPVVLGLSSVARPKPGTSGRVAVPYSVVKLHRSAPLPSSRPTASGHLAAPLWTTTRPSVPTQVTSPLRRGPIPSRAREWTSRHHHQPAAAPLPPPAPCSRQCSPAAWPASPHSSPPSAWPCGSTPP